MNNFSSKYILHNIWNILILQIICCYPKFKFNWTPVFLFPHSGNPPLEAPRALSCSCSLAPSYSSPSRPLGPGRGRISCKKLQEFQDH